MAGPASRTVRLAASALALLVCVATTAARQRGAEASDAEPAADSSFVELAGATVVVPASQSVPERTAARMLVEEISKRTNIRLPVSSQWPGDDHPVIALGPLATSASWAAAGLRGMAGAAAPGREGYRLAVNRAGRRAPTVLVLGSDPRGILFGAGRLLRELRMTRGGVRLAASVSIVSTPHAALRGHQLGYRPKTNAYDAWDVPMWEQYIRDLAVFGTNAIELIPPRSDDAGDSPTFRCRRWT